jgi:Secretion system C-terminal sorting domain/BD-FAE
MKIYLSTLILLMFSVIQIDAQERYLEEIFTDVNVTSDVLYSQNITIITGAPTLDTLYADYYMPEGDTDTSRPLVIYLHTGSFLPVPLNGQITGTTDDYTVTEVCTRLAKMGYVAAAITYRKGWNPLDPSAEVRRNQLINAAYRGIQDIRAFIRFNHLMVEENGNPFGVDPNKIAAFGQGTGGYIALGAATLDDQNKIYIPKFQDPQTGDSFIDTLLVGDIYGLTQGLINIPNHVGYSSDLQFSFNAGGALGDESWVDENSVPMAAAHVVDDPFAPFWINPLTGESDCEGPVVVPTTNEFVVDVAGSKCVIEKANAIGVNDVFNDVILNDPFTLAVEGQMYAAPNLWAIDRPTPEAGPWDWWDENFWDPDLNPNLPPELADFHANGLLTNPDMSLDKANRYIDTLVGLFAPRACLALELGCNVMTSVEELIDANSIGLMLAPNPAEDYINFEAENAQILDLQLYDISGRMVKSIQNINSNIYQLNRNNIAPGIYIAKVRFEEGVVAEKVVFK